ELPGKHGAIKTRWNASSFVGRNPAHLDSAAFDVRLNVPKGYSVGATGEQVGAAIARGNRLVYRFVQNDVVDFAWTADSRFAAPLEYMYTAPGGEAVTLRVLYQPEHAAAAASAMDMMADAFGYYSRRMQAYPYRTLTAVITPYNTDALADRTYPALFTVEGKTSVAPGTLKGERLDLDTLRGVSEMYFSSVLGNDADPALIQGITTYWTARRLHERGQTLHVSGGWMQRLGLLPALNSFSALRLVANLHGPVDGIGNRAARIALSLHDLQEQIGTPAMDRAFSLYSQRQQSEPTNLASLRSALADGNRQRDEIELAFAQNIEDARLVDDRIASFSSEEVLPQPGYVDSRGKRIELTRAMIARAIHDKRREWRQQHPDSNETVRSAFPYRTTVVVYRNGAKVPQVLQVKFADGSTRRIHWNNTQPSQRFTWITTARAVSAQLDPQQQILLDRNKLDDGRTLKADSAPARRWGGDVAAAVQIISGFLVSL
ncbi:MAG TPA: hypothetical protein VGQ93_04570, partial [Lysobacter sp.]|nr:hypothetical protein [Lysobacter sp.]